LSYDVAGRTADRVAVFFVDLGGDLTAVAEEVEMVEEEENVEEEEDDEEEAVVALVLVDEVERLTFLLPAGAPPPFFNVFGFALIV